MARKAITVWLVAAAWISMNTVGLAVNCNCCCKALDRYGFDQMGGAGTKCWGFDKTIVLEGLVVDSGNCLQESKATGFKTDRWEFYGCDLLCVGRNPAGFTDPNPLQEAEGDIPDTAVNQGPWDAEDCITPFGSTTAPPTACG